MKRKEGRKNSKGGTAMNVECISWKENRNVGVFVQVNRKN